MQGDSPTTAEDVAPDAMEYAARRARVLDAIGPDALALLQGAPAPDGFRPFRQSNDFYYLCGIEVPHSYLLLNGRTRASTLYLPHRDAHQAASEGEGPSAEDGEAVRALAGVEKVEGSPQLAMDLAMHLLRDGAPAVYVPLAPAEEAAGTRDMLLIAAAQAAADAWDGSPARHARFVQLLRARFPQLRVQDISPILDRLRLIKSPAEVALMRRAARLCGLGIMEAMRATRPGVREYQLAAIARLLFGCGGAQGDGYRAIVAGGANAWYAHYSSNQAALAAGDLVLMDYAPDVQYYTSDIGRMWPVSGTYQLWQRELYGFVVTYHQRLLARIRPGVTATTILCEAAEEMRAVIDATGFSNPAFERAARRMLDYPGHLSHPVGMAVHDVGDYWPDPLAPGLAITVDPQMWVPEERLYVRVEDTVVVTQDGIENLTGFVPREPGAIELWMREPGPLNTAALLDAVR